MKFWKLFRVIATILFVIALGFVFLVAKHRLAMADEDTELQAAPVIVR